MNRNPLLACPLLILVTAIAQAQTPAYVWDANEGGLVDQQTGLVWGFGPTNAAPGWLGDYEFAVNSAGELYANNVDGFGFGFTDWHIPTKAQLQDAVTKNVYQELSYYGDLFDAIGTRTEIYQNGYWASDAPFREKGLWKAYHVNLFTGSTTAVGVGSAARMIVVRQASPPPTYVWDEAEGGLRDLTTGLVWGFGPTNLGGPGYTYQNAIDHAADDYAAGPGGSGFTDWRVPSKAELEEAADNELYGELVYQAAQSGLPMPLTQYWGADPSFKSKGSWWAYVTNLDTGVTTTMKISTSIPAIVVRQASGN